MGKGWQAQMTRAERHFTVVRKTGGAALKESFTALVEGRANPNEAWVHSL